MDRHMENLIMNRSIQSSRLDSALPFDTTHPGKKFLQKNDLNREDSFVNYSVEATTFAAICSILFVIIGVSGNLLTMVALLRCAKLRRVATSAFVISLCAADLLFCAINLPLTASRYINRAWVLGDTLCRLFPFFFYGNVATSLISMTAITINRYILISHFEMYDRIYGRLRNVLLMIASVWLFSFSMLAPPLLGFWGTFGYNQKTFSCTILRDEDGKSPKKFLFIFGFLLPCIVIVTSYARIFHIVTKSRRKILQHNEQQPTTAVSNQNKHKSEDMRLTRLMLLIFCSFLICFLPLMIVNVFDDDNQKYPWLHIISSICAWASSCINPVIYAVMNRQYRQAYAQLICPGRVAKTRQLRINSNSNSSNNRTVGTEIGCLQNKHSSADSPAFTDIALK